MTINIGFSTIGCLKHRIPVRRQSPNLLEFSIPIMRKLPVLIAVLCLVCLSASAQTDNLTKTQKKQIAVYANEADYLFSEPNYYRALSLYLKLITLDSTEEYYWYQAGICYLYTDEKEKSITYLNRVHKKDPQLKEALYYLGRAYHVNYSFDTAIVYFKKYLGTNPPEDKKLSAKNYIRYCNNAKELVAHPVKVKIDNLGPVVNTPASEYAPVITADESELIFTYNGPLSTGGLENIRFQPDSNGEYYEDIFISHRVGDNWTTADKINELNTKRNDASIAISTDGQELFTFGSTEQDGGDIYYSDLDGNTWGKPIRLGPNVNTEFWEGSCSLSSDGKILYFASERPGGFGGRDIYFSLRQPDGSWGVAKNIGGNINTPLNDDSPFIHADGVTLFFSSEGWNSMGGSDIFYSSINTADSTWNQPINLGYPINSPDDDRYYVLNADGTRGYFSSNRKGGYGQQDIYSVTPGVHGTKPVLALTIGVITKDEQPAKADISVTDTKTNENRGDFHSNATTGKYVVALTPGTKYKIAVQVEGTAPHIEYLDVDSLATYVKVQEDIHTYTPEYKKDHNISVSDTSNVLQASVTQQVAEYKAEKPLDVYAAKVYQRILNDYGQVDSAGVTYNVELGVYQNAKDFDSTKFRGLGKIESRTDNYGNTIYYIPGQNTMLNAEILKYKVIQRDSNVKKYAKLTVDNHGKREQINQFYYDEYKKDREDFVADTTDKVISSKAIVSLDVRDKTKKGSGVLDSNKMTRDYGHTTVNGLTYKIELGSYTDTSQFKLGYLSKYGTITKEVLPDGTIHYYIGAFNELSQAQAFKADLIKKEPEAEKSLVMVFYFGNPEKKAEEFFTPPANAPCDPGPKQDYAWFVGKDLNDTAIYNKLMRTAGMICVDNLIYHVQIGAYRHPENYKYKNLKSLIPPAPVVKGYADGITRFTMREFKTLLLAEAFRQVAITKGTKDAWITAEYKGERVLLQDLIKTNFYNMSVGLMDTAADNSLVDRMDAMNCDGATTSNNEIVIASIDVCNDEINSDNNANAQAGPDKVISQENNSLIQISAGAIEESGTGINMWMFNQRMRWQSNNPISQAYNLNVAICYQHFFLP